MNNTMIIENSVDDGVNVRTISVHLGKDLKLVIYH